MLMVNALAGTGKTSTTVMGLGVKKPSGMVLSDEQKAIIRHMRGCGGTKAAQAFNKSISIELEKRVPAGCECGTSNSFGHRAWAKHVGSRIVLDNLKIRKQCRELIGKDLAWKERMSVETAVDKIISLCKCYLFDPTSENGMTHMKWLADRFDIDFDPLIAEYAVKTFEEGLRNKSYIDFNDQNFLPIYHDIKLPVYDHMLVDEVQDLNRAKIEMALRMGKQVTAVGDRHQAIYGFSGADSDAMDLLLDKMEDLDDETITLPLTITRRCSKAVTALAQTIVPEFRCTDDAVEGKVASIKGGNFAENYLGKEPSMIICRINAPLTSLAFKMIANGQRCYIQGRDIGKGIKAEIKRSGQNDLRAALRFVNDRIEQKCGEIRTRPFPDETQIEALQDKLDCIRILSEGCDNVGEFEHKVDSLFKDSGGPNDTRLSSGHKAKGLEHRKVFIYRADKMMLPSKQEYQREQEKNLAYVMYTRSLDELYKVYPEDNEDDR